MATVTAFREYRNQETFRYEMPDDIEQEMLLLSTRREIKIGYWEGRYGQRYIAWYPLPARDPIREKKLITEGIIKHNPNR